MFFDLYLMSYAFDYNDGDGTERIVFDTHQKCVDFIESHPELQPYVSDIYPYTSPYLYHP